ncbi:acyl carrier protein [Bacteroidota bacterium]
MDINNFTEQIREQFLDEDQPKVTPSVKFRELETWDSLTGMAVLTIIHDEYDINIPVDDFISMHTINELFDYVKAKKSE